MIGLDPDWLADRFRLFEAFCYPSVKSQTDQNFKWIVLFDEETPQPFKDRIENLSAWKNFVPVYVSNMSPSQAYKQAIVEFSTPGVSHIITTRLDNDDAICKTFIEKVHGVFRGQEFEFVSFPYGACLNNGKVYSFKYYNNPFISLIEKVDQSEEYNLKTVISINHINLPESAVEIKQKIAWLQIVHGNNVTNRTRGIRQRVGKDFNFAIDCKYVQYHDDSINFLIDYFSSFVRTEIDLLIRSMPESFKNHLRYKVLNKFK